jgi:plasmid stabilization system protein ParE
MNYEFLKEARDEFRDAVLYYDSCAPGLGLRFKAEIVRVIERMIANPYLWSERAGGFRRVNCPVFPYYLAYFIRGEKLIIAAVAHGRRKPGYWMDRIKKV